MSISVREARQVLTRLGITPHEVGDGRTYWGVPYTHKCGEETPWLLVTNSKRETVESIGAHCGNCQEVEAVPIDNLRLVGKPILAEIEEMARRLEEELASNEPWFKQMIAGRINKPS